MVNKMTPVRLLHITGNSKFGGAGRIIISLGQMARAEGWHVDVLTTNSTFQRCAMEHGLGVVDLDVIRREIRPFWDLAGLSRLSTFLRSERYGIVHTHTSKAGFVGRCAARLARVPVIVHTAHGFAFHERSRHSVQCFYSTLERAASHWCDRIVSVSEFHRRWAVELGICDESRIVAIPNGIADLPETIVAPSELRRRLGARPNDLLILSMARLAPDKGLGFLIQAAALLARFDRRFLVVIAGAGPERAALEKISHNLGVTDRVVFLGFREDVSDLLAAADLVVLPSLREGLSIALLEAMSAAKPIIATNIGSHQELVSQGDIALLVPPADPQALCETILQMARDPILMARLGTRARALYEHRYTEARMLNEYRSLYSDLLKEKCQALSVLKRLASDVRADECKKDSQSLADAAPPETRSAMTQQENVTADWPGVRRATALDLLDIVRIHQKAFANYFLTTLGTDFLTRYYALVLNYRAGIVLVSERGGRLEGFACGFVDPSAFYRLMWRNRCAFVLPALSALLRQPSLAAGVLYGVRRIHTSATRESAKSCELSSIAVAPEASGNGLGKALIRAFTAQARSMAAECIYLTTDAEGNEQANMLYRHAGFQRTQRFLQRKGRWMNEYVINQLDRETAELAHE